MFSHKCERRTLSEIGPAARCCRDPVRARQQYSVSLTRTVLSHLLDLSLHRLEVERSRILHRRIIDCGLRQLRDVLLHHDEAPEFSGKEVVAITEGAGVRRLATGSGCALERILANVD